MNILKLIFKLSILTFLFALVFACSSNKNSDKESSFHNLVPIEMNTNIQFVNPPNINGFKIGDFVDLGLENKNGNLIKFPNDYGIKILSYKAIDDTWNEISNDVHYSEGSPQISPKGTNSPGIVVVSFSPKLDDTGKPIEIRVVVVGTIYENNTPTETKTGAYIDITLQP